LTATRTPRVTASDVNMGEIMDDRPDRGQEVPAGLCATCRHAAVIASDRGSRFVRCGRSQTDPSFPRYPQLPVRTCRGYDRVEKETA
jgi:hypothetical protein